MSYNGQTDQSGTDCLLSLTSKKQSERCDLYSGYHLMAHCYEVHKNLGEEKLLRTVGRANPDSL